MNAENLVWRANGRYLGRFDLTSVLPMVRHTPRRLGVFVDCVSLRSASHPAAVEWGWIRLKASPDPTSGRQRGHSVANWLVPALEERMNLIQWHITR